SSGDIVRSFAVLRLCSCQSGAGEYLPPQSPSMDVQGSAEHNILPLYRPAPAPGTGLAKGHSRPTSASEQSRRPLDCNRGPAVGRIHLREAGHSPTPDTVIAAATIEDVACRFNVPTVRCC